MTYPSPRSTEDGRTTRLRPLVALLCCTWTAIAAGDIFRYQDEQGNWHFTDDPPEGYESSIVPGITTSKSTEEPSGPTEDLAGRLQSAYSPITPIAYATLAVVSIKTGSGEASGFFCSEQGHILTNRHVVRPDKDADQSREDSIQAQEEKLRTLKAGVHDIRDQLRLMEQDLKGYEGLIENARDDKTQSWAKDAHQRLSQRYQTERGRVSAMDRSARKLKTELRNSKREMSLQHSFAAAKNHFEIVLKDGTELTASLVGTSDVQDLALLKVDGYRTPFLRLDPSANLSQGIRVFAIGSPLGMQDAVTSGVVTQVAPEHLLTDAQILPGSSGGPLIRESGEVIGINVSRRVAAGTSKYSAGFGKAIPIALALQEFPDAVAAASIAPYGPAPEQTPDSERAWTFEPNGAGGFSARQIGAPNGEQTRTFGPDDAGSFGAPQIQTPDSERTWSFGPEGAINLDSGQSLSSGPDKTDGARVEGKTTGGSLPGGAFDSVPVRLIVRDGDDDLGTEEPADSEPRSLDFPPEGGGIPPGISRPQE